MKPVSQRHGHREWEITVCTECGREPSPDERRLNMCLQHGAFRQVPLEKITVVLKR